MNSAFTSSLSLLEHPMKRVKIKLKEQYCIALRYIVDQVMRGEYTDCRLQQYYDYFMVREPSDGVDTKNVTARLIDYRFKPWRKKYCFILMCDTALLLNDREKISKAAELIGSLLSSNTSEFVRFADTLVKKDIDIQKYPYAEGLAKQVLLNLKFSDEKEKRFMITATISSGKSTLINALVGRRAARTASEECTGSLGMIYSKPFEDGRIHIDGRPPNFQADVKDITKADPSVSISSAMYFKRVIGECGRICFVDTPGVNSWINKNRGEITRAALAEGKFDTLVFLFDAGKLGSDEVIHHLRWIKNTVPEEKTVFVVNKLDLFDPSEDSISKSINGVRNDLLRVGYKSPTICPISAYFSFLVKKKLCGDPMTEDEEENYSDLARKFRRRAYDLSGYYEGAEVTDADSEELKLSKKCGLYGLEQVLYGKHRQLINGILNVLIHSQNQGGT